MKTFLCILILALSSACAKAAVVYQQSPNPAGGVHVSAWWDPDGSNYDRYIWDSFTLTMSAAIDSIEWRGAYGASGAAYDFTVAIYASIPAGTQPDFSKPPLIESQAGSQFRDLSVYAPASLAFWRGRLFVGGSSRCVRSTQTSGRDQWPGAVGLASARPGLGVMCRIVDLSLVPIAGAPNSFPSGSHLRAGRRTNAACEVAAESTLEKAPRCSHRRQAMLDASIAAPHMNTEECASLPTCPRRSIV